MVIFIGSHFVFGSILDTIARGLLLTLASSLILVMWLFCLVLLVFLMTLWVPLVGFIISFRDNHPVHMYKN